MENEVKEEVVEVKGIKELKEAIIGVNELALFLCERLKDGIGVDDAVAVFNKLQNDDAFMNKMKEAFDGVSQIPAEVKDFDLTEGMELAMMTLGYVPKYVNVFKK